MIGQENLLNSLSNMIQLQAFPPLMIFEGEAGSGKRTLVEHFSKMCDLPFVFAQDTSVDTVREIINLAYKTKDTYFVFLNADGMSNAAKNALLKVTEEPPNNSYFIMTLEDINNTLPTIKSRATVFPMERYTPEQLIEYVHTIRGNNSNAEKYEQAEDIIKDICNTPGEVNTLTAIGVLDFYEYVELAVDKITQVSGANAFKLPSKIALKENDEGYDLKLFWKTFAAICMNRVKQKGNAQELMAYCDWYSITSMYLKKLRTKGVNRQMLVDCWILAIRSA